MNDKPNKIQRKIAKLQQLETRGQNLQNKMDKARHEWETVMEQVKDTPEWKEFCSKTGRVTRYNWGDCLA